MNILKNKTLGILTLCVSLVLTGCASFNNQSDNGINISQTNRGVEITSSNSILFDTGKYEIKPSGQQFLDQVANILLTKTKKNAIIEGHTDAVGGVAYNQDLSELRALTVMKALVDKGVPKSRLKAVGYGSSRPVTDNNSEASRRLNRRTDIIILGESKDNIGNPFLNFINNLFNK